MDDHAKHAIELQLNAVKNLPALPEAGLRILNAINTPDISIDALADVLMLSPGLVARLLGLANSAYFARGTTVTDIHTAIFNVLGLDLVKALSLAIIFNVQFDTRKCPEFETEHFWMRSLITADAAQKLAGDSPLLQNLSPSAIYVSGLLLDIGVLVLSYLMPDKLNDILSDCKNHSVAVNRAIGEKIGVSHYQIGFFLFNRWHLPELYQTVLQQYENAEFAGVERSLINLLQICSAKSLVSL